MSDIEQENKEKLLLMRRILFAALVRNAHKEDKKGMYAVALAIFNEFEKATKHLIDSDIASN